MSAPQKTIRLDLEGQLMQLEKAELVRRLAESELAYLFKHTLTQETAYESLLLKKRREIHLEVARLYEQFYPDRLDEFAPLLAHHYGEAGVDAKALEYENRAGDVSARRYANAEANASYSRALQLAIQTLPDGRSRVQDLYLKRGRVLELSGHYEEALGNYDEMEALAIAHGDRAMELASLMARATLRATPTPVNNPMRARDLLERALPLSRELGDVQAEAKGLWNMMILSKFGWHPQDAIRYGEQSLALARKYNLREQMAYTLNDLAVHAYMDSGDYGSGLKSLDEAKKLWLELDNQPMLADTLSNAAMTHFFLGDFDSSLNTGQEARSISERIGNQWGQSYSRFEEGDIYFERGEVERAIETMKDCIDLGERAGFVVPSVWIRSNLAFLYGSMGDVDRGVELAELAKQSAESRLLVWRPWPLAIMARLEVLRGRIDAAEWALEETQVGPESRYLTNLLLQMAKSIALGRAELALAQARYDTADGVTDQLLGRLRESGGHAYIAESLLVKARAAIAAVRLEEAREILLEARSEAAALGSRWTMWRILAELAKVQVRLDRGEAAVDLRREARAHVDYIAAHTPTDLRRLFLSLPDVRDVLGATGEIGDPDLPGAPREEL